MNTSTMYTTRTALCTTDLRKAYGAKVVLDGVDLGIDVGKVLALLGPNGAGKTTVVQILSTLIPADAGVECLRALLTGAPIGDTAYLALAWCAVIALGGYLWARTAFGRGGR